MKFSALEQLLEASGAPCLFVNSSDEIQYVSRALKDQMLHAFLGMEGRSFYEAFEIPKGYPQPKDLLSLAGAGTVKLYLKHDSQLGAWKVTKVDSPPGFLVAGETQYTGVRPSSFEGIDDFVQYSREGFLVTKPTGEILDASPRFCEMFGYTKSEVLKLQMADLFCQPSTRDEMISHLRKNRYYKSEVIPYFRKNGSVIYCEISNILIRKGSEEFITGYMLDVTDRVLAEKEAQKAQDLVERIMVTTKDVLYVRDLEGRCLMANPALAELVGTPLDQLLGSKVKLTLPFDKANDAKSEHIIIDKGGTIIETEEILGSDGRARVFHLTRAPIKDNDGNIFALFGVGRDITENHRLRLQLEESFERFKVFIEEIPFAVAMFDRDLNYVTSSNKWRFDFHGGLSRRNDLKDIHFFEIFPRLHTLFSQYIDSCLAGNTHASDNDQYSDGDGVRHYLRWSMVPWSRDDKVMGFILMIENLDSAMEMEKALEQERAKSLRNTKLAALGEMATVIAHEINNPLAIIQTSNDLIRQSLLKENIPVEMALGYVDRVRNTVERVSKIIKSLKNISRDPLNDPPQSVSVRDIVEDSTFMHREKFRLQLIDFKLDFEDEFLEQTLYCKPVQVAQIIINLLSNAQDAVEASETKWIRLSGSLKDGFVEFRVTDSGPGIEPTLREIIFEPFYTTKSFGQGTGLGLSISRELASSQGCQLFLDPGTENTTFILKVPHKGPQVSPGKG